MPKNNALASFFYNKIAQSLGEDAHRFWTIFNHWINKAYQQQDDPSTIRKIGTDETLRYPDNYSMQKILIHDQVKSYLDLNR